MTQAAPARTGGQILVDQLVAQGVERVYCVPGESYLAALDALHDAAIAVTVCRQEAGAAMMALTEGRLTGRPGVCFVTRGPGATNAAHGVHIAEHDSAPMILFVGQVERAMRGRGAFQEMDYRAFFGSTAKWATEIDDPARIPEIVQRAFHTAMQGRPGPVVIALPEDVLTEAADVADAPRVEPAAIWPGQTQMAELQKMLWAAKSPIAILGGGGWSERAGAAFMRFAERFDLPVAASFRRASLVDGGHPNYAGEIGIGPSPKLKARIEAADLVLLIGGRMSEMPSQSYTLFAIPEPRQTLVHVHADALEIGRVYHPAPRHRRDAAGVLRRARRPAAAERDCLERSRRGAARAEYLAWSDAAAGQSRARAARRDHAAIARGGARRDLHQRRRQFRDLAGPLPALSPLQSAARADLGLDGLRRAGGDRRQARLSASARSVAFAGDGDFLMNGQEFATAVQYDLPIVVVVIDNGMYGTIRMHQEREYPGRISATQLRNPDFAAYARAFGGHGETVEETAEFLPAFARALRLRQAGDPAREDRSRRRSRRRRR